MPLALDARGDDAPAVTEAVEYGPRAAVISERQVRIPVSRSRHVVPAIVLVAMAAFATWNVVNNANWPELVLPFGSGFRADVSIAALLALTWWAGGLGLLTGTTVGVWLGRLGAGVLMGLGIWLLWDTVAHPSGSTLFGNPLLIVVPLTTLAVGAGIGILVALRRGADHRPTAGRPGGGSG